MGEAGQDIPANQPPGKIMLGAARSAFIMAPIILLFVALYRLSKRHVLETWRLAHGRDWARKSSWQVPDQWYSIIIYELESYLIGTMGRGNAHYWVGAEFEYKILLREKWSKSMSKDISLVVWSSLVDFHKQWIPALALSPRQEEKMQHLLNDPHLTLIKRWTDRAHARLARKNMHGRKLRQALLTLRDQKQTLS